MTSTELTPSLTNGLQDMAAFLSTISPADWQRPQGGKWTIAQELAHILIANTSTARLLSPVGRAVWRVGGHESRSYDTIRDQYLAALANFPGANNPNTNPTADIEQLTPEQQLANWQQMATQLLSSLGALAEADLDGYTVWKHPLIGPFTVREMIYFTDYHTQHHLTSLRKKSAQ
jgi:hypothetical protein